MRRLVVVVSFISLLLVPALAGAHTTELCYSTNDDGSVTMWAKTNHFNWWPDPPTIGGVIIDGQTFAFSDVQHESELPSDAVCFDNCPYYFGDYSRYYQTVTVQGLAYSPHTVTTTKTSIVEYPDYCVAGSTASFGSCQDPDRDGVCSANDNCPNVDNGSQSNVDGDIYGDACDPCPHDPKNDADGDSICGNVDYCANTPQTDSAAGVPSRRLNPNHYAYGGDTQFMTTAPSSKGKGKGKAKGPQASFSMEDTGGCSCSQIIDQLNLGKGHEKFGCSLGVMRDWADLSESGALE